MECNKCGECIDSYYFCDNCGVEICKDCAENGLCDDCQE